MKVQRENMKRGILGVIMIVCILVSSCFNTYAAEADNNGAAPASIDVNTVTSISISSTGTATATCTVTGTTGVTTKISITMTLQKKAGSGKFYAVDTWSGTKSSYYYRLKKTSEVSKGTYRVMAKVTCYEGSNSETIYKYSGTKTY